MTVVSDTSPINYLVLIELQELLPALFEHVLISSAVRRELQPTMRKVRRIVDGSGMGTTSDG